MTPKQIELYVSRLEKMLLKADVCEGCPVLPYFKIRDEYGNLNEIVRGFPEANIYNNENEICLFCQSFVDLDRHGCPCLILGKDEAISRAVKSIAEYRAQGGDKDGIKKQGGKI